MFTVSLYHGAGVVRCGGLHQTPLLMPSRTNQKRHLEHSHGRTQFSPQELEPPLLWMGLPVISFDSPPPKRPLGYSSCPPAPSPQVPGETRLLGLGAGMGVVLFTVSTNAQLTNN